MLTGSNRLLTLTSNWLCVTVICYRYYKMPQKRKRPIPPSEIVNLTKEQYDERADRLFEIKWICSHKGIKCILCY